MFALITEVNTKAPSLDEIKLWEIDDFKLLDFDPETYNFIVRFTLAIYDSDLDE